MRQVLGLPLGDSGAETAPLLIASDGDHYADTSSTGDYEREN